MLDIAELIPLLDDIKFANRQIKYNAKRQFLDICDKISTAFSNHDDEKYIEVIEKLENSVI